MIQWRSALERAPALDQQWRDVVAPEVPVELDDRQPGDPGEVGAKVETKDGSICLREGCTCCP